MAATSFFLILACAFLLLVLAVVAMAVGVVFFGRKPIQHCGRSGVEFDGQRIDCPLCQGSENACPESRERPATTKT